MDASTAAAIASVCGAIVGVVTVIGQVLLARQAQATHKMVNSMASRRRRVDRAEGAKLASSAPASSPTSSAESHSSTWPTTPVPPTAPP